MDVRYTSRDLGVVDIRMAWAETHTLRPRYCEVGMGSGWDAILWSRGIWYVKLLDVRQVHRDLVWIWDATWIEVKNGWTCMEVMQYMDGGETWILGSWYRSGRSVRVVKRIFLILWCVSDGTWMELGRCSLGTWMEVRHHLDVDETRISGPFWRWEWTWIAVRCESSDLDGDNVLCGDGTRLFGTWIQLRRDLSEVELYVIRPVWISNGIWMELRCNYEE